MARRLSLLAVDKGRSRIRHLVLLPVSPSVQQPSVYHWRLPLPTHCHRLLLWATLTAGGVLCRVDLPLVLLPHQLVVSPVVLVRHQHLHLIGQLIRESYVPTGVDLVQLPLAHVRHPVLAHVLVALRALPRGPPGEQREEGELVSAQVTGRVSSGCQLEAAVEDGVI